MHPVLKNILGVILGWFGGSLVNMGLITLGHSVVSLPSGVDQSRMNDMEYLAEIMPTFGANQFIFPLLAHAIGTLVGAFIAAKIAGTRKMMMAMIVGIIFFIGGIAVSFMLPAPTWVTVLDLIVAYIPMAYLGGKLGSK